MIKVSVDGHRVLGRLRCQMAARVEKLGVLLLWLRSEAFSS